jgi:hypothetical protein
VRVDELDAELCSGGAADSLWRWLGLPAGSQRNLAEQLAKLTCARPRLLIASPVPATFATWIDELRIIVDLHQKLPSPGAIAFLVVVRDPDAPGDACRLDVGWPAEATAVYDDDDRWSAYLHERVAWHSGGDIERAIDVGAALPPLMRGDDQVLEAALNEHAAALFARLPKEMQEQLGESLDQVRYNPSLRLGIGLSGAEARSHRPAPWLARALLNRDRSHPQKRFLSSLSGCRPLANRLLGRCMDLEQRIRDHVLATPPWRPPSTPSKRLETLRQDSSAVEHRLTPLGRVASLDEWDAASLNEVIGLSPDDRSTKDGMHELRYVRNALAHGTAVGWNALAIVDRLEDALR